MRAVLHFQLTSWLPWIDFFFQETWKSHASFVLCVNNTSYCGFSDNSDQQAKQIQEIVLVDYYCSGGVLDPISLVKDVHGVIKDSFVEPKPFVNIIFNHSSFTQFPMLLAGSK